MLQQVLRRIGVGRSSRRYAIAVVFLLGCTIPLTVYAVNDASRNPQPSLTNNFNDVQDLARVTGSAAAARGRPAIGAGNDTIGGRVTDASTGAAVSGATVYLSDVPQPCNHSSSSGPCAAAMQTATTDGNGNYSFAGIANGTYNLAVSRVTAGGTMYPQTAPGVVPAGNTNQQGVTLNLNVGGNTTANFSLQPFAAPGSRVVPSGHAKNLVIVDFDETYATSWFNDTHLASFSTDVNSFANSGVNDTNGFSTYGWSPVDHYSIATGQYPYWRLWDPWPNNLCNWAVSGNGGSDCGIDTNMFYCSGSCVPEAWGQMSIFDVAKAYGMSTAVIGGSDYPTGHIDNANVDSIQLGSNSQCTAAGCSSCQWETEAENWISGTGGPNANGFLLYFPVTPAEGSSPESTSPDTAGSLYQNAQKLDDQVFTDFRNWLNAHGYLAATDMVVVADEAENDHTSYDNFYGTNSTKNVPMALAGPDYVAGLKPTTLIHLDDIAATALGGMCLPPPPGDRGVVQTSYLRAACPSGGPTATSTPAPAATATPTPVPAATVTNTPRPGATATSTSRPAATATSTPAPAATNTPPPVATSTPPPGGNGIVNGGFETGSLAGWTATINQGMGNAEVAPQVSSAQHHTGAYSALIGSASTTEPDGDSCLYQDFTTSGGTFAVSYLPFDPNGDTISYDWQEGYVRPAGSSGCAEAGTQVFKVETNSQTWTQASTTVAGGSHQAYLNVHEDGYGDPTYMYVDDVSAPGGSGTPTPTPTAVAATPTPHPTGTAAPRPTATSTPAPNPTATPPAGGNIIVNPGFESGPGVGWSESSSGGYELIDTYRPHTGRYSADECNYNNCTDYVQQQITVPNNANLHYWWYMTSSEPTTRAYDYMKVQLYSTSGALLATLRTWSNTSTRNAWSQDTLSLAAYGGQTVVLRFTTTTDYTQPTNFFIDDVAVP